MKFLNLILLGFLVVIISTGCGGKTNDDIKKEETKIVFQETSLTKYNIEDTEPKLVKLNSSLIEISGLAITNDARLFTHEDEKAKVFEINYETGETIKSFNVGDPVIPGDFEGIAIAGNRFFLVSSNGNLLEFTEGGEKENVPFTTYKTELGSKYDVEGLCYDSASNSLLLACKGFAGNDVGKEKKAIYAFSLDEKTLSREPRFLIDLTKLKGDFNPSGIEFNPFSKTFFVIASKGNSIIELSATGEIINQAELPKKYHGQPEGIAFLPDKSLVISNEGGSGYGYLALYKYNE